MSLEATEPCSAPPSAIAAQYETLRSAALGEVLPPEARSGLMLFLRRGMWGWARTLPAPEGRSPSFRTPSSSPTALCEGRALIHVFAALAMNTPDRRAL